MAKKYIVQHRRGTDASWRAADGDPIPQDGEIIMVDPEDDSNRAVYKLKVGDGVTLYDNLPFLDTTGEIDIDGMLFKNDLTTTFEIGNVKLTNGSATIPAVGKTLNQVWDTIFLQEKNPTITPPSVNITSAQIKAYEVGTKVTPSYNVSLYPGAYEYGPSTGITASSWSVTDSNGGNLTTSSGTFSEFTVSDSTQYRISAVATHGAGAIPKTNTGNDYTAGRISAGTKSKTSDAITGYRNGFYGTLTSKTGTIDSTLVRALSIKSNKTPSAGNVWNLSVPVGAIRVVFAYPATLRDVNSVLDVNGMNAEIKSTFTKYSVSIQGANGYSAIGYKVYVYDMAKANETANTFMITI